MKGIDDIQVIQGIFSNQGFSGFRRTRQICFQRETRKAWKAQVRLRMWQFRTDQLFSRYEYNQFKRYVKSKNSWEMAVALAERDAEIASAITRQNKMY